MATLTNQEKEDYSNSPIADKSIKPFWFCDTGMITPHVIVNTLFFICSQFHLHMTVITIYLPCQTKPGVGQWFSTKLRFEKKRERNHYEREEREEEHLQKVWLGTVLIIGPLLGLAIYS